MDRRAESTKSEEKLSGIDPLYTKDRFTLSGNGNKNGPKTADRTKLKGSARTRIRRAHTDRRRRVLFRIGKPEYHEEVADEEAPDTEVIKRHGTDRFSDPYRGNIKRGNQPLNQ